MKDFFNKLLTLLAAVLAVPSFLIIISWNALPQDSLYSIKTGLEKVALLLTIKTPLASFFSIKFTDRRFVEATRLLAKRGSTIGYQLLVAEAQESKEIIVNKKDTRKAAELVEKIEAYQKQIEEKKVALSITQEPQPTPTATAIAMPTPGPSPTTLEPKPIPQPVVPTIKPQETAKSTHSPTPSIKETLPPKPEEAKKIIEDLSETQKKLEKIKHEVVRELPAPASGVENKNDKDKDRGKAKDRESKERAEKEED